MKKRILIVGNNHGLMGVNIDIKNFYQFFRSPLGGSWEDYEIDRKVNPRKIELQVELELLKKLTLDYLIIVFSGHGGQTRETVLELNSSGETINDSELKNIARRQLNIYDSCRSYPEDLSERATFSALIKSLDYQNTRIRYETRILQAMHQQASLYSCSIGEGSWDSSEGGIYSTQLIKSAKKITAEFKSVGAAHVEAAEKTLEISKTKPTLQHPDAVLLKCMSYQELIISINPSYIA
jgi:hypothetical protein